MCGVSNTNLPNWKSILILMFSHPHRLHTYIKPNILQGGDWQPLKTFLETICSFSYFYIYPHEWGFSFLSLFFIVTRHQSICMTIFVSSLILKWFTWVGTAFIWHKSGLILTQWNVLSCIMPPIPNMCVGKQGESRVHDLRSLDMSLWLYLEDFVTSLELKTHRDSTCVG